MDDSIRHHRGGDEAPESPLVFSVPTSLQEYMSRHMERPAERTPPPPMSATYASGQPPVRHRFDRGIMNNSADAQQASASSPLRAGTTAHQLHANHHSAATHEPTGGLRRPLRSDYLAAWRAILGAPHDEFVEAVHEPQVQHSAHRRFVAHRNEPITDDREGGMDRRGVHAHSASRGGRPQSSTAARRSGGGLVDGWSGSGVGQVSLSPMNAAARDRVDNGDGDNSSSAPQRTPNHWWDTHQAHAEALLGGSPANLPGWRGRGPTLDPHHGAVDERTRPSRGGGSLVAQANRGRRSLSDFLREIEDMVRAQREQHNQGNGLETGTPRTQTAPESHENTRSRPLVAAAAAMAAAASRDRQTRGSYGGQVENGIPPISRSARYVPPGGRQLPWPATDNQLLHQPPAGANATLGTTAISPRHLDDHSTVHGAPPWNHAPFARNPSMGQHVPDRTRPPVPGSGIPTLAATAAAVAAAEHTRPEPMGTQTGAADLSRRPRAITRDPLNPPFQLSAAATAFSMSAHGDDGVDRHPQDGSGAPNARVSVEEGPARQQQGPAQPWYAALERRAGQAGLAPRGIPAGARGGRGHGQRDGGGFSGDTGAARVAVDTAVAAHLRQGETDPRLISDGPGLARGGRTQQEDRRSQMQVSRMVALPSEGGTAATRGAETGTSVGDLGREIPYQEPIQSNLMALPAFRHWESQRARLRIQWHEQPTPESPASDGTLVLTEHPSSSNGPSPQARGGVGFGRYGGARPEAGSLGSLSSLGGGGGGSGDGTTSKVEEALFSCLMSLGIRRLLLEREGESAFAGAGNRRSPGWLEDWLDGGACPSDADRNSCAPSGHEGRCPRAADVWELLELLLAWWAERVCAVAAGFPMWSDGQTAAAAVASQQQQQQRQQEERSRTWQQHQQQRRARSGRDGNGSLPDGDVAVTRAVQAVHGLRKLGECIMPLRRIQEFIGLRGGPTPRDAVLLKSLLVVHEGIAWAVDRPHYRYYREEVIPTALQLYASLPQDVLEGVDLEVGHTLPESLFVVTGTTRPSWPRWDGSSPTAGTPPAIEGSGIGSGGGGTGSGGGRTPCARGPDGGDSGGGAPRFLPGPWVIFRVARGDYLDFYRSQEAVLNQAVGVSAAEAEHMLM